MYTMNTDSLQTMSHIAVIAGRNGFVLLSEGYSQFHTCKFILYGETLSKDKLQKSRRTTMQAVHSKDTKPEMAIRKHLSAMGYRYRLHRNGLPGKPDVVFIKRRKAIFVHGCFWHGHTCAAGRNLPKTNRNYWIPKLQRNQERDKRNIKLLKSAGWTVLIIWECQIKRQSFLSANIKRFLDS